MRGAWIALALVLASKSLAQAPEANRTTSTGPAITGKSQNKTNESTYPTVETPLPIAIIQSDKEAASDAGREKKTDKFNAEYLKTQQRMADASEKQISTALLVVVVSFLDTAVAVFALFFLMKTYRETKLTARASIKAALAAKKSAKAAEISAKAAMGTALPNLMLSKLDFGDMGAANLAAKLQSPKIEAHFVNFGSTFAIPKNQSLEIACTDVLAPEPIYRNGIRLPFVGLVVEKNTGYELVQVNRPTFSTEEIEDMQTGEKFLWVYGYVGYEDFLGNEHERRFCKRLYINVSGSYVFADGPNAQNAYTESY